MKLLIAFMIGTLCSAAAGWALWYFRFRRRATEDQSAAREMASLVEKLERADSSRIQIIEELSHDLRTPLTSILTLFETISDAEELSPDFVRECAAVAIPEIEYVNHLIRDLFLLAQMNEPGYAPASARIDLRQLLTEEVSHLGSLAETGKSPVKFELKSAPSAPESVAGDGHLLRRLLRNVLANSGRFARGKVSVSFESVGNHAWRITVADDGKGFDPDAVAAFFGGNRPSMEGKNTSGNSLGLGSVIISRIVKLHGGNMRIFNKVGDDGEKKGAVVQITFPLAYVAENAARKAR